MQARILLVEDNPSDQLLVTRALAKDYLLKCASSSEEAFSLLNKESFDLILLDISLPVESGFHICVKLKSQENTRDIPVFFLTGQLKPVDKVMGFSVGADDYIVKPFEISEFRARIESKLKKQRAASTAMFAKGPFQLDINKQKAFIKTSSNSLKDLLVTTIEFRLLHYFLRHEEHVLSRQQLLEGLWGHDNHVSDRTIDTHIYTLRKKLGAKKGWIQSVHGIGYKFHLSQNKKSS